jgi:hypothetical protein
METRQSNSAVERSGWGVLASPMRYLFGAVLAIRQRQPHDETMTCGNQPANIRWIIRRDYRSTAEFDCRDEYG